MDGGLCIGGERFIRETGWGVERAFGNPNGFEGARALINSRAASHALAGLLALAKRYLFSVPETTCAMRYDRRINDGWLGSAIGGRAKWCSKAVILKIRACPPF